MKQISAPLISNTEIMPDIYLLWLEAPDVAAEARPGQYVMVNCGEETVLPRPFSIHKCDGSSISLLVRIAGKGTKWLSQCKVGNNLEIFGPLGNGFSIYPESRNLLLVAGGIGIAPLCFLMEKALKLHYKIKLLIGVKTAELCYPDNLLPDGIDIIYTTEDATLGRHGKVTILIPDYFEWTDQIFACGPESMYRHLAKNFPQLKNKPIQVSLEVMMGCGRGICYGCTIKTRNGLKKVCEDGPVFNLNDIYWD
jgi:dihydroorotate dehydrogenase electron transfer subunit